MSFLNPFRSSARKPSMGQSQSTEHDAHSSNPNAPGNADARSEHSGDDLWIGSPAHGSRISDGLAHPGVNQSSAPLPSTSQSLPPQAQDPPAQSQDIEADELWVSPGKHTESTPRWSLSHLLSVTPGKKVEPRPRVGQDEEEDVWQSFVDARTQESAGREATESSGNQRDLAMRNHARGKKRRASRTLQDESSREGSPSPPTRQHQKRRKTGQNHDTLGLPDLSVQPVVVVPPLRSSIEKAAFPTPPVSKSPTLVVARKRKLKDNMQLPQSAPTIPRSTTGDVDEEIVSSEPANMNGATDGSPYFPEDDLFIRDDESLELDTTRSVNSNHTRPVSISSRRTSGDVSNQTPLESLEADLRSSGPFSEYESRLIERFLDGYCSDNGIDQSRLNDMIQNRERGSDTKFWGQVFKVLSQRSRVSVRKFCRRKYHNYAKRGSWGTDDDKELMEAYRRTPNKWVIIGEALGRMPEDCRDRWRNYKVSGDEIKTGEWTTKEEIELSYAVSKAIDELKQVASENAADRGEVTPERTDAEWEKSVNWKTVSANMGNSRTRLQCYQHWQAMERKETNQTIQSRTATPQESPAIPPSQNWRRKAADRSYEKMLVGDKIQILLQVQEADAVSEDSIPWARLTASGDQKWSTMDRRLAFENMKQLLNANQLRKPLDKIIDDLIDYFETKHYEELNDFYESPRSKRPSAPVRNKHNGRFMPYDTPEDADDVLNVEEDTAQPSPQLGPVTPPRRQSIEVMESTPPPHSGGSDEVVQSSDAIDQDRNVIDGTLMSDEIVESLSDYDDAVMQDVEVLSPEMPKKEQQQQLVIEETEDEASSRKDSSVASSSSKVTSDDDDESGSTSEADEGAERTPSIIQTNDQDAPTPAKYIPSASDSSSEAESDTSEAEAENKDVEAESAHGSESQSESESESASQSNDDSGDEVVSVFRDRTDRESAPHARSTTTMDKSNPEVKTWSEADTIASAVNEPKVEVQASSEPGSQSDSDSESASEASQEDKETEKQTAQQPHVSQDTKIVNSNPITPDSSDESDSDVSSHFPYDSPNKPNEAETIANADKEAVEALEEFHRNKKKVSWKRMHDRWEGQTRKNLSPQLFGVRIEALLKTKKELERQTQDSSMNKNLEEETALKKTTEPANDNEGNAHDYNDNNEVEEDDYNNDNARSNPMKTQSSSSSSTSSADSSSQSGSSSSDEDGPGSHRGDDNESTVESENETSSEESSAGETKAMSKGGTDSGSEDYSSSDD